MKEPSLWILDKLSGLSGCNLHAIDIASGSGRHSFALLQNQFYVTAVDRNVDVEGAFAYSKINFRLLDLEDTVWPLSDEFYDLVLVSDYLYRPFLSELVELLKPGGHLIYETFGVGNEVFGKPSNPEFLLKPKELAIQFKSRLQVLEDDFVETSNPKAIRARFFARKPFG